MKMQALLDGKVVAESADTIVVEGNHYFPLESVNADYLSDSTMHTVCPWKGVASYYHVAVDDVTARNGAWYYPKTSDRARNIEGRVAFWRGVQVRPAV